MRSLVVILAIRVGAQNIARNRQIRGNFCGNWKRLCSCFDAASQLVSERSVGLRLTVIDRRDRTGKGSMIKTS